MGGEPLLRPKFIHKIVITAPRKTSLFTCRQTDACEAQVIDLSATRVSRRLISPSIPSKTESLYQKLSIRSSLLEYLVKRQHHYGYTGDVQYQHSAAQHDDV